MAFDRLKQWGQTRMPLGSPEVMEVDLGDLRAGLAQTATVSEVQLPVVGSPLVSANHLESLGTTVSDDYALHKVVVCSQDMSLAGAAPPTARVTISDLSKPEQQEVSGFPSWSFPSVLSLLKWLEIPGRAGKAYGTDQNTPATGPAPPLVRPGRDRTDQLPLWQDRCKHGLLRSACELCAAEDGRFLRYQAGVPSIRRKSPAIDVFDLLLAYLQPPLELLLAQPLLFPPNRRPDPYQVQGVQFLLSHPSALLGDEMGLGKTVQAIVGLQGLFRHGRIHRALVLCPRSLLGTWEHHLRDWAPELFVLKVRGDKEERRLLWESPANVFLSTYETLRQDTEHGIDLAYRFDAVILDEAQKIKNPDAGLSQAVRRLRPAYRWGLTGTPLENRVDDVVSIFQFLSPELFRRVSPPYSEKMVRDRIAPYFLRRRVADVLTELPEKVSEERWLYLNDDQQASYDAAYWEGRAELEKPGAGRIHVFSLINQLKQICNLDPRSGSSAKLDYLEEQLAGIMDNAQKALVFSQFPNRTLREIEPRLSSFGVCVFDGSLSDSAREAAIKQFEGEVQPRVLLMSVKAGGLGLTLTRANHVFHLDHWWNPAVARQAEARAHRRGQKQTVFVYDIWTIDTIEHRIYDLLARKQHLFDVVIDDLSAEGVQKWLTDEDLFGLFDLKAPAGTRPSQTVFTSSALAPQLKAKLRSMTPGEFEQLVARLYNKMGFVSQVTPLSHDGGIDVVARRLSDVGREHLIIQCKHMPDGVIGEPIVRELIGTWHSQREATRAVLVTTGRFSSGAIELANNARIDLVDGVYLEGLLLRYSVD
jgi:superfamily II DNA or RNA helicase